MELTTEKINGMMQGLFSSSSSSSCYLLLHSNCCAENQMIDRLGIRVRVMGDLSMVPEKTRIAIDKVVNYSLVTIQGMH